MTTNRRKKTIKQLAHTTHGWGHRKKRRGAGNRGGRGNAGSGKRGKVKKQITPPLGKHGFTPRRNVKKIQAINLNQLQLLIKNKKLAEKDGIVNLTAQGYHKLLSTGNLNQKLKIKIAQFSPKAEEKVKAAGGEIISAVKKENIPKEEVVPATESKEKPEAPKEPTEE